MDMGDDDKRKPTWTRGDYEKQWGEMPDVPMGKGKKRVRVKEREHGYRHRSDAASESDVSQIDQNIGQEIDRSNSVESVDGIRHPVTDAQLRRYHREAMFTFTRKGEPLWPRNWLYVLIGHKEDVSGESFASIKSRIGRSLKAKRGLSIIDESLKGLRTKVHPDQESAIKAELGFSFEQIQAMDREWSKGPEHDFFGTYDQLIALYGSPGKTSVFAESFVPDWLESKSRRPKSYDIIQIDDERSVIYVPTFNLTKDLPSGKYHPFRWRPRAWSVVELSALTDLGVDPKKIIIMTHTHDATGEVGATSIASKLYVDVSRADINGTELVFRLEPDGKIYVRKAMPSAVNGCVNLTADADPSKAKWWLDMPVENIIPIGVVVDRTNPMVIGDDWETAPPNE